MNETLEFLVRHGAAVLFAAVFVEQLGVPLPAAPWMLAAGGLAATGKINWFVALTAATIGSGIADLIWLFGTIRRSPRGKPSLPDLAGAGLVRSPDARSLHALRDAGCRGGEIHSRLKHIGAAAGGQ